MNLLVAISDLSKVDVDPQAAIALVWTVVGAVVITLLWPNGRGLRLARQITAVAVLAFREGVRLKVLWTVFLLALIPGILAYYSDADGTHVGRASLILNYCLSAGEILGAVLIGGARDREPRHAHVRDQADPALGHPGGQGLWLLGH